ncbi:hypothetical protein BE22_0061 [Staphylococcus phage vB_SepS_BE22]|nr:hypothetical protein BE22_0061 [Staphylococcus phage vB_SepS_BE22]
MYNNLIHTQSHYITIYLIIYNHTYINTTYTQHIQTQST